MAHKNPLEKIKDLTLETLKSPKGAAREAVGQAKGVAVVGRRLTGQAGSAAAGAVAKLVAARKGSGDSPASTPASGPATSTAKVPPVSTDKPVNVTEELGLDPAPVERTDEPVTSIDAAAEREVAVTPADIAPKVSKKAPARKPAATKAPAAKKTATKKTAPGAKLPPRKRSADDEKAAAGGADQA